MTRTRRRSPWGVAFLLVLYSTQLQESYAAKNEAALTTSSKMLTLGQLSEPFQLLSQYSYGAIKECPDKYEMAIAPDAQADFASGTFDVQYSNVEIDVGSWYGSNKRTDNIICAGPRSDSVLTLQAGTTVSVPEFIRRHLHSPSTLTLFETLAPRLRTGNYWFSAPKIAPFNCSKNDVNMDTPWFTERFTLVFFCEQEVVPIKFIGKVRPNGSERIVLLNLTGTIRYFIATAPQTTCIYRSVNDVERYEEEERRKRERDQAEREREQAEKETPPGAQPNPEISAVPVPKKPTRPSPVSVPTTPTKPTSPGRRLRTLSPSCNCTCDANWDRSIGEGNGDNDGQSKPGGPWYEPVPAKNKKLNGSNWYKRQQKAPYAPRPYPEGDTTASVNPVHSWRWNWFRCVSDKKSRIPLWEKETSFSVEESGERACFPSSAMVETLKRGRIRMDSLRIGDAVRMGPGQDFSRVFMFTHSDQHVWSKFINLSTKGGLSLTMSPGHLLPADDGELIRADNVRVGQTLNTVADEKDTVTEVNRVADRGLFNPQTVSGTILVDGVLTSCYTTEVVPPVAHALLAPVRTYMLASYAIAQSS